MIAYLFGVITSLMVTFLIVVQNTHMKLDWRVAAGMVGFIISFIPTFNYIPGIAIFFITVYQIIRKELTKEDWER